MTGGRPEDAVMASCEAEMIVLLPEIGEDEIAKMAPCKKPRKNTGKGGKKQLTAAFFFGSDLFIFSALFTP